jgi:hypothetical protein
MANRRSWTGVLSCERQESCAAARGRLARRCPPDGTERGPRTEEQILEHFNGADQHADMREK